MSMNQTDFNNLITSLMTNYTSQTTAHAGYLIALAVGIGAIFYQADFKTFFTYRLRKRGLIFYFPVGILAGTIIYFILRTIFWAWMSSEIVTIPNNIPPANATTPLGYIQSTLVTNYSQITGWSNLAYNIDQKSFGLSLVLSVSIMVLLMLIFDFAYFHLYHKNDIYLRGTHIILKDTKKWKICSAYILLLIFIALILISIIYPPWITPSLQSIVNCLFPKK